MNIQDAASPLSPEVFSGNSGKPCDSFIHVSIPPNGQCPYESQCLVSSLYRNYFADTYENSVTVSRVETSSNLVIRGEQQVWAGDVQRTVIRKHIFEGRFPKIDPSKNRVTQSVVREVINLIAEPENAHLQCLEAELKAIADKLGDGLLSIGDLLATIERACEQSFSTEDKPGFDKSLLNSYHFDTVRHLLITVMSSGLPCRDLSERGRLGRYLGYIDIRLTTIASPISFAVLVPPRSLRHDPRYRIIQTELGSLFGGPAVHGTVYAMVDPSAGLGGSCSTAAILMAIACIADRGGRPQGHVDITLAAATPLTEIGRSFVSNCIHSRSQSAYRSIGLDPGELKRALDAPAFNVTGSVQTVSNQRLLLEEIRANIDTRCPVILFVNFKKLWGTHPETQDGYDWNSFNEETAHVVVVVGYSHDMSEIIVHDPCIRPYIRVSTNQLVAASASAAYRFDDGERQESLYTFAFVASKRIQRHLHEALDQLRNSDRFDSLFLDAILGYNVEQEEETEESEIRFDYEFAMLHRDDIFKWLSADGRHVAPAIPASLSTKKSDFTELENEWYWAIVAVSRDPQEVNANAINNSGFWLISAESTAERRRIKSQSETIGSEGQIAGWRFRVKYLAEENSTYIETTEADPLPSRQGMTIAAPRAANPLSNGGDGPKCDSAVASLLGPALLTSSSELPLDELLSVHHMCSGVSAFELYLLRRVDLGQIISAKELATIADRRFGFTEWMQYEKNISEVYKFIVRCFAEHNRKNEGHKLSLTGLATFFVGISSFDRCYLSDSDVQKTEVSGLSGLAIENAMRLADRLWRTDVDGIEISLQSSSNGNKDGPGRLLQSRIVEIVLGSVLDVCSCAECNELGDEQIVSRSAWEKKAAASVEVLKKVVERLKTSSKGLSGEWGFAIEIEPGENRILPDIAAVDAFFKLIDDEKLDDHVGLNLDIAHCILCGISPESLFRHAHRIMNAHISDHPGMHTRDHVPGRWRDIERPRSAYFGYLRLLETASTHPGRTLPFSGRLSLELEGCSTESWCDAGVAAIRRLLANLHRPIPLR